MTASNEEPVTGVTPDVPGRGVGLAEAMLPPPLDVLAQEVFAAFGQVLVLPGLAVSAECGLPMVAARELSGRLVYSCRPPGRIRWRRVCGQHRVNALEADHAAWNAYGASVNWWPLTLIDSKRGTAMHKRAILLATVAKVCLRIEDGKPVTGIHTTGRRRTSCWHYTP